jgi:hypothetical protein
MEKFITICQQLPLPEVGKILRRVALTGLGVGIIALAVGIAINHVFIGLGIAIGISIGLFNIRMIVKSVAKVTELSPANPKRMLAVKAIYRLAISTLVIIALVVIRFNLGAGAVAGVAFLYIMLMAVLMVSIYKSVARTL